MNHKAFKIKLCCLVCVTVFSNALKQIISATLDNFVGVQSRPENGKLDGQPSQDLDQSVLEPTNTGDAPAPMELKSMQQLAEPPVWVNLDISLTFIKLGIAKTQSHSVSSCRNASQSPPYWSKVCLHNMTALAKRATTVRRVLEPFFLNFDSEDYWSPESGLAYSVLMHMQQLLEESGSNWSLLSNLVPIFLVLFFLFLSFLGVGEGVAWSVFTVFGWLFT